MNYYSFEALNDLEKGFRNHVIQSSSLIYSIKHQVYRIVNINIGMHANISNIESMGQTLKAGRQNIDDLKRIDSLLKGFAINKQNEQEIQQQNSKQSLRSKKKTTLIKNKSKQNLKKQLTVQNLDRNKKQQNILRSELLQDELLLEIESMGDRTNKEIQRQIGQDNTKTNLLIKQLQIQIYELRKQNQLLRSEIKQLNSNLQFKNRNQLLFSFGKPPEEANQTIKNKVDLVKYKEQISISSTKIRDASSRNKQCLQLLKKVKDRLDQRQNKEQIRDIKKDKHKQQNKGIKQKNCIEAKKQS